MSRRRSATAALVMSILGVMAATASAAGEQVVTSPICCSYTAAAYEVPAGQVASIRNGTADGVRHTATADTKAPYGPLFESRVITTGQTAAIGGSEYLEPGTYKFHCDIHGFSMVSKLVVTAGKPQARPGVQVAIPAQSLQAVKQGGKLTVGVTENKVAGRGVVFKVAAGGDVLARFKDKPLAPGAGRNVRIPLRGAKALPATAKITVTALPRYGATATTSRTLH